MTRFLRILLIVLMAAAANGELLFAAVQKPYQPNRALAERDATPTGTQFERYFTLDKFGRKISFFLSRAKVADAKLPLMVFIQGSGCTSNFTKHGELVYGGMQNLLLEKAGTRARVMVVEKPGVEYLYKQEQPGSAEKCSPEFLTEHTPDRWGEAIGASLKAAWQLPGIDAGKTLVVGHSEGGIMAARVAAENPQVTHVASLAGGGPTQLFDLVEIARQQAKSSGESSGKDDPAEFVYE
ncbi:MAG TPA: hypothetical protein PKC13_23200, partial [Blastocatellia bacterium]|nr:hypothetical protein [Blastocatellia bacterium]